MHEEDMLYFAFEVNHGEVSSFPCGSGPDEGAALLDGTLTISQLSRIEGDEALVTRGFPATSFYATTMKNALDTAKASFFGTNP